MIQISIALFSSAVLHCFDNLSLIWLPVTYDKMVCLCNILLNILQELVDDTGVVYAYIFLLNP